MENGFYRYKDEIIYLYLYRAKKKYIFVRRDRATQISCRDVSFCGDKIIFENKEEFSFEKTDKSFNFLPVLADFYRRHFFREQHRKVKKAQAELAKMERFLTIAENPTICNSETEKTYNVMKGQNILGLKDYFHYREEWGAI